MEPLPPPTPPKPTIVIRGQLWRRDLERCWGSCAWLEEYGLIWVLNVCLERRASLAFQHSDHFPPAGTPTMLGPSRTPKISRLECPMTPNNLNIPDNEYHENRNFSYQYPLRFYSSNCPILRSSPIAPVDDYISSGPVCI